MEMVCERLGLRGVGDDGMAEEQTMDVNPMRLCIPCLNTLFFLLFCSVQPCTLYTRKYYMIMKILDWIIT